MLLEMNKGQTLLIRAFPHCQKKGNFEEIMRNIKYFFFEEKKD